MGSAAAFAEELLREMVAVHPAAKQLGLRARGQTALLGITDEVGWEPLLRLSNPSDAYTLMSLDVRQHGRWTPTFHRGTPAQLAQVLTGDLHFLWWAWVDQNDPSETSGHEH